VVGLLDRPFRVDCVEGGLVLFSRLRKGLDRVSDAVRTQLWPLPTFGVLIAVLLGVGLPELDRRIDEDLPDSVTAYLFGGGASAARMVLDAIASSLITVTALTFSLTVVTLQLASSQFSPRLLRTFSRDRFVHVTLAIFLATFTYALTVLRTVRDPTEDQSLFVPQVSVTVAFLLALASVVALVLFLAHLVREIRVETMLHNVHRAASATTRRVLTQRDGGDPGGPVELPVPPENATSLPAGTSGFLVSASEDALLAAALDADAVVLIDRYPGSSLVAGTPLGLAWPASAGSFEADTVVLLRTRVADAVTTGFERTEDHDVAFGLRQLGDVACKALSPGINDPTTAIHALGHMSALLCQLAGRDLGPVLLRDEQGSVRVVLQRPDLADLLEVALTQPRRYGAADPMVLGRLVTLLRELAWSVQLAEQREAVSAQLDRLRATVTAQDFDPAERARLDHLATLVEQALVGRWVPDPAAW